MQCLLRALRLPAQPYHQRQGVSLQGISKSDRQACAVYLLWVHKDTGARRFKRTYNKRGRSNFKSTEKSGQALYHMCGDTLYPPYRPELAVFEQEPEVECAAVDRSQAMRVFGDAKKIAAASPNIARRLHIPRSNPVTHLTRGGYMRALSKDTKNKDSGAPSYFVVDEYHAHPTSDIYDIGLNSFGKRPQALLDVITTAGDDAQNKPCYREETYAKQVLDSERADETYFVMIRELDEGDNPHNKALWVKPNPCLRYPNEYSKYLLEQIETEFTAAFGSNDPHKMRQFLTRRMCQWQTGSVNRYLDENCMTLARKAQVPREEFAVLPAYIMNEQTKERLKNHRLGGLLWGNVNEAMTRFDYADYRRNRLSPYGHSRRKSVFPVDCQTL